MTSISDSSANEQKTEDEEAYADGKTGVIFSGFTEVSLGRSGFQYGHDSGSCADTNLRVWVWYVSELRLDRILHEGLGRFLTLDSDCIQAYQNS